MTSDKEKKSFVIFFDTLSPETLLMDSILFATVVTIQSFGFFNSGHNWSDGGILFLLLETLWKIQSRLNPIL